MSKRAILKLLAFLGGLYFMLEFLLPVKYGGDFDSYEVGSPAPMATPDGVAVLYSGRYDTKSGSIGRAFAPDSGAPTWSRVPDGPVLGRAVTSPTDRAGMEQMQVVPDGDRPWLLYLGADLDSARTLCVARGNADGTRWKRAEPVRFFVSGKPVWSVDQPNGLMPELQGSIRFYSAQREDGRWHIILVFNTPGAGDRVLQAEGENLSAMRVELEPVYPKERIPSGLTAFDGRRTPDGWELVFVEGNVLRRVICRRDGTADDGRFPPLVVAPDGVTVTAIRRGPDAALYLGQSKPAAAPTPEGSPNDTTIAVVPAAWVSSAPTIAAAPPVSVAVRPGKQPHPTYLSRGTELAGNFIAILAAFPVFLAMLNLSIYHGKRTIKLDKDSVFSLVFFVCLAAMLVYTIKGRSDTAIGTSWREGYDFLFNGILQPVGTAVFSMITFYLISAAYRSFRVRSVESALLMVAAAIVMLGQTPIGEWASQFVPDQLSFLRLPIVSQKLLTVVNASAARGIMIGMAIASLAISIRIWLGTDASAYSGLGDDS